MVEIVRACVDGVVSFAAPRALTGELEVFSRGDTLAVIGTETVRAPSAGFVARRLVADGARVDADEPLLVLRSC